MAGGRRASVSASVLSRPGPSSSGIRGDFSYSYSYTFCQLHTDLDSLLFETPKTRSRCVALWDIEIAHQRARRLSGSESEVGGLRLRVVVVVGVVCGEPRAWSSVAWGRGRMAGKVGELGVRCELGGGVGCGRVARVGCRVGGWESTSPTEGVGRARRIRGRETWLWLCCGCAR